MRNKPRTWAKHLRHRGKRSYWHSERSASKRLTNQLVKDTGVISNTTY